jgi:hypothetical protein
MKGRTVESVASPPGMPAAQSQIDVMQPSRKQHRDDPFERALKESFGEQTSLEKVEQARRLYARYRTSDLLERLKRTVADKSNRP